MSAGLTRRTALRLVAAAAALPLTGIAGEPRVPRYVWDGVVLGGKARMIMAGLSDAQARDAVAACLDELERLDRVFSLYRGDSALVELNRAGILCAAPADLRQVVAAATRMTEVSGGAFDATVQPLWLALAGHTAPQAPSHPGDLIDGRAVDIDKGAIRLPYPGMAVTLNGIAQGYIADRVADLLASWGLPHALLELGEVRALGDNADGGPWRVGVGATEHVLELSDGACATSAAMPATRTASTWPHIIDPRTASMCHRGGSVTVRHPRAMWADAVSTALCVAGPQAAPSILAAVGANEALFVDAKGAVRRIIPA